MGLGNAIKGYGEVIANTGHWLATKPIKATTAGLRAVAHSKAGRIVAGGLAGLATGLGIKEWHDKRRDESDERQAITEASLGQHIAENRAEIARVQASIANQSVPTDKAAKVEAAGQQQAQSASLSA